MLVGSGCGSNSLPCASVILNRSAVWCDSFERLHAWSAGDAAAAVGSGFTVCVGVRLFETFRARGLARAQPEGRLLYQPSSDALAEHGRTLERVYRERPVTLIRVIYGLRDSRIRSFADAFKLRGK